MVTPITLGNIGPYPTSGLCHLVMKTISRVDSVIHGSVAKSLSGGLYDIGGNPCI